MFRKVVSTLMAGMGCTLVACAGPLGGKGQGESCTSQDECADDLTCQPITGQPTDVCCPTPPDSSTASGCHAVTDGG